MNINSGPTIEQLRQLIKQCDDAAGNHLLWVKRDGEVELSMMPGNMASGSPPEMQLRYETFMAGNEYVGPEAANDVQWLAALYDSLLKEWSRNRGRPEVAVIELNLVPVKETPLCPSP